MTADGRMIIFKFTGRINTEQGRLIAANSMNI